MTDSHCVVTLSSIQSIPIHDPLAALDVLAEAARAVRKQEALRAFLDKDGVPRLTPSELAEILAEWEGSPRTSKRARKPRAA